ncbi:MAG: hypothetical protein GXY52_06785 [Chloroflexi bacterium]|nr:hypothetical protein [Chloroflexota bacterium]
MRRCWGAACGTASVELGAGLRYVLWQPEVVALLARARAGAEAVIPRLAVGGVELLHAFYHRWTHAVMQQAVSAGERRVGRAVERLKVRYVEEATLRSFVNINSAADLEAACALLKPLDGLDGAAD